MDKDEKLLSTIELAEYLGIKASTLREYRVDRKGPPYIKIGHLVRYKVKDIEAWIATQQH